METGIRSMVKAVMWQAMGLGTMLIVGILYTGSIAAGGAMAGINTLVGLATYMIYERIWARVTWGRPVDSTKMASKMVN